MFKLTLFTVTPFLPTDPSPRKSQPVHVEGKASRARLSTLCSSSSKEDVPHFLRTRHHRWSKQGFSGSHTSTHLSAQEKSHRPKGILLSHHVETDQGTYFHCFGWDAGPEFNHLPTGPIKDKHLSTAVCATSLAPCLSPLGRKSLKTTTPSSLSLSLPPSSVAILAQAISCSNVRGRFSR